MKTILKVARLRGGVKRAAVKAEDSEDDMDEDDEISTGSGPLSALTGVFANVRDAFDLFRCCSCVLFFSYFCQPLFICMVLLFPVMCPHLFFFQCKHCCFAGAPVRSYLAAAATATATATW